MTDGRIPYDISRGWIPDAEGINRLPLAVRDYVHMLEARADPALDLRELHLLRLENQALRLIIRRDRESVDRDALDALLIELWQRFDARGDKRRALVMLRDERRAFRDRLWVLAQRLGIEWGAHD